VCLKFFGARIVVQNEPKSQPVRTDQEAALVGVRLIFSTAATQSCLWWLVSAWFLAAHLLAEPSWAIRLARFRNCLTVVS